MQGSRSCSPRRSRPYASPQTIPAWGCLNPTNFGMGAEPDSLDLYHDDVLTLSSERKIEMAQVAEQAALDADPRVNNSEGGGFGSGWSRWVLANSRGFAGPIAVPVVRCRSSRWRSRTATRSVTTGTAWLAARGHCNRRRNRAHRGRARGTAFECAKDQHDPSTDRVRGAGSEVAAGPHPQCHQWGLGLPQGVVPGRSSREAGGQHASHDR